MNRVSFLLLFMVVLSSCSSINANSKEVNTHHNYISSFNTNLLKSVEVSKYRSDSIKSQPELINVYSEQAELEKIKKWVMSASNTTTAVSSPIDSIFLYRFIYQGLNNIEEQKMLIYVKDRNNDVFIHQISADSLSTIGSFDTFHEEDLLTIMSYIGGDGWYKTSELIMNEAYE